MAKGIELTKEVLSPLSGNRSELAFSETVLSQYRADYFIDPATDFIFVNNPHWLSEAYSSPLSITDTGILSRNIRNVEICTKLLNQVFPRNAEIKGIDLGGGYGIFVRGMRDAGFDFHWHDLYAENLIARGFEARREDYDVAVAFEVLEHTVDPIKFLLDAKSKFNFRYLIFSATCFDPENIPNKEWWYWSFESGQHISFFSEAALRYISEKIGMRLKHLEKDLYLMEEIGALKEPPSPRMPFLKQLHKVILGHKKSNKPLRGSLTWSDHVMMRDCLRSKKENVTSGG